MRFVYFTESNPVALIQKINDELEDLGHCIYFGKDNKAWIAVFDLAPQYTLNASEIDNSISNRKFLVDLEDMHTTNSA